jgi:hypothetical protein
LATRIDVTDDFGCRHGPRERIERVRPCQPRFEDGRASTMQWTAAFWTAVPGSVIFPFELHLSRGRIVVDPVTPKADDQEVRPLSDIRVARLRTTFFWPLTLDRMPGDQGVLNSTNFLQAHENWLRGSPWKPIEDGLRHLPMPPVTDAHADKAAATDANIAMADAYGEFVYFHDFVQRMLFGKTGGKGAGPMRLFQRTDITAVDVNIYNRERVYPLSLKVERLNLYIFAYGVAVVALQVSSQDNVSHSLGDVLSFNDRMRRSHIPYYERSSDGKRIEPRSLPEKVTWKTSDGSEQTFDLYLDRVEQIRVENADLSGHTARQVQTPYSTLAATSAGDCRRVLPVTHWQWLLNGPENACECIPLKNERQGYRWRHFSDDRFPILTTIILESRDDYYSLSEGHWMRLAFVDPEGTDPYPYAPAFLRETFAKHCYDRYHHDEKATADEPVRYLMCDYAMTAVTYQRGPRPDYDDKTKTVIRENYFAPVLQMHMQRHYYQMFLLQVIDKAVMLGLSSRITRAVERFGGRDKEAELSVALQDIERDFLQYVHRFRFTGVSGQLQATELHNKLREVMGLDAMFQDIKTELETAIGFLSARSDEHATEAAERLNIVASLGVVIALVLGFFSLNILTTENQINGLLSWMRGSPPSPEGALAWQGQLLVFASGLSVITGLSWVLSVIIKGQVGRKGGALRPAEAFVQRTLAIMFWIGLVLAVVLIAFKTGTPITP